MTYFNTTNEKGRTLKRYRAQADSQEAKITAWFRNTSGLLWTPSEIREHVFGNTVPVTSVRRAMTNLTTDHALVKTEQKHLGPYGRPEYCWRRKTAKPVQHKLFVEPQS